MYDNIRYIYSISTSNQRDKVQVNNLSNEINGFPHQTHIFPNQIQDFPNQI